MTDVLSGADLVLLEHVCGPGSLLALDISDHLILKASQRTIVSLSPFYKQRLRRRVVK